MTTVMLLLTSTVNNSCLLDRLLEDTESVVEGALRLIQDLLSGSSDDNSARLTQRDSRETKKLHTHTCRARGLYYMGRNFEGDINNYFI